MQQKTGKTPPRKTPARVTLPVVVVPQRGSPFAGISQTHAPAHVTAIPHLTAQVQIAKARQQRLDQGGLLTKPQRVAEQKAAKTLAKPDTTKTKAPLKAPPVRVAPPAVSPSLPAWLTQPAVSLAQTPQRTPASVPPTPPGSRGAPLTPREQLQAKQPGQGSLLGGLTHAADVGLGTAFSAAASVPRTLLTPIHPGSTHTAAQDVKPTTLKAAATDAAARLSGLGALGRVPSGFRIPSIDLVAPSGAATIKGKITLDELKQLEDHGYDLSPRLKKKFTAMALKNGHTPAELDGISGSATIDAAFTKPAPFPLRELGAFAGGVAKLGTLPAGLEGAGREIAAGHGLDVAQKLGEGLYSELPVVGKHPFLDTLQADPFGALTQFAGAGKIVGEAGRVGRAEGALREVTTASSELKVNRGVRSKNAYTATGQMLSDKAAANIPALGGRLEAQTVDKAVRSAINKHAPAFVQVQRAYKASLDKVGSKRAAVLQGYQAAGGKPEQIAAFYRAQGEAAPAKFFDRVAQDTKALSEKDHEFLATHAALTQHTSDALISSGKFGDTAAKFRAYSPLIRSAGRLGDPEAQRILALRDEYIKGFDVMPEQDVAALRGAIDQGVNDFAAKHTASGGIEPARVAYSQPKPLIASPFTPSTGGPVAFKTPRGKQKAETGATFESGKYLIDPASPLAESVRAQREHLATVLHQDVASSIGQHLTAGDAIPAGHVFVSETNLRGLRRTTNDLADNPVSSPDYYAEEAGVRQKLHDHLTANTTPSGQRVPRGEKGYAIPEAAWRRILDHTRPPSRNAYMKFMRQYQRVLVSYRPSTIVNNTIGSMPLAVTGGAITPRPWLQAARAMSDPSLAPAVLRSHGVAGSFAPDVRSHVGAGLDFMRAQSARGEDFSRLATFFSKAGRGIKKRAEAANMTIDEYQRAFAAGTVDEPLLNQALDHTEAMVGDLLKPDSALARKLGGTILFHRWIGHIAKLLLYTLPVNHPRRLVLLQTLAAYGDQYRQDHGVWPDWYREYLPLFQHVERLGRAGRPQTFTKTFSTAGVNPFSSINNLANPVSTDASVKSILAGIAAPPISVAFNTIANRPYDSTSAPRYLAGQIVRQIPGVSVVRPQGGMGPDSIPFVSEQRKVYSSGHKVNGKTVPLPWEFRPGARAEGGILGGLLRYGLGGVYDVPAQGPVHNIEQKKHIGAVAKAARLARKS